MPQLDNNRRAKIRIFKARRNLYGIFFMLFFNVLAENQRKSERRETITAVMKRTENRFGAD